MILVHIHISMKQNASDIAFAPITTHAWGKIHLIYICLADFKFDITTTKIALNSKKNHSRLHFSFSM